MTGFRKESVGQGKDLRDFVSGGGSRTDTVDGTGGLLLLLSCVCVLLSTVMVGTRGGGSILGLPKFSSEPTVRTELPELNCQFKFSSGSGSDDSRQFRFAVRALRKF